MFIVIAYDIPDNKRRSRLFKLLKRFGAPVQFSIFECLINDGQFEVLRREVAKLIVEGEDDVRYYDICAGCKRLTKTFGKAISTTVQQVYIC
jgi:CRISPR-associated protein Cas2